MSSPYVLVVDDEPVNREIASELLGTLASGVDFAQDGMEAVALASDRGYDLILMDLQMPRMDGLEASRRIRRLPGYAHVPILAFTANGGEEVRAHCSAAGIDDVLSKPVVPETFDAVLREWLALAGWMRRK